MPQIYTCINASNIWINVYWQVATPPHGFLSHQTLLSLAECLLTPYSMLHLDSLDDTNQLLQIKGDLS